MTNHSTSPASQEQPQGGASQGASGTVLVPDAVAALGRSSADYDALSDEQVLAGQALIGRYWLTPPPGLDPEQRPIPLTSKNALTRWSESGEPHS